MDSFVAVLGLGLVVLAVAALLAVSAVSIWFMVRTLGARRRDDEQTRAVLERLTAGRQQRPV